MTKVSLTKKLALKFVEDPDSVDISKFTHITLGAATVLGEDEDEGECEHDLDLSGLVEIDSKIAEALALNQGDFLDLSGLTNITSDILEALEPYSGSILLNGLKEIDEDSAHSTYCLFGPLELNGIQTLSESVADALSSHSRQGNNPISLSGISQLTPECALKLARHGGGLYLDGLVEISVEVAAALAEHQGGLFLGALQNISDDAAEALSKCVGELSVNLDKMSESAVSILKNHQSLNNG